MLAQPREVYQNQPEGGKPATRKFYARPARYKSAMHTNVNNPALGIISLAALLAAGGNAAPAQTVDHAAFDALLKSHVKANGVDYVSLAGEKAKLQGYVASLAAVEVDKLGRDEKMALFINAYNAGTLLLICEYGGEKLKSIKDISSSKRWKHKRWNIGGKTYSLDNIEHDVLRPEFRDARVHAAVNCASVGCPPLRAEAYVGEKLNEQLDDQTRKWINNTAHFRVQNKRLYASKITDWFAKDFKRDAGSVAAFVRKYAKPPLAEQLSALGDKPTIKHVKYDWSLNKAR